MQFYDLVEELREKLCKQVDVLNQEQLRDNLPLVEEILRDGVKIASQKSVWKPAGPHHCIPWPFPWHRSRTGNSR